MCANNINTTIILNNKYYLMYNNITIIASEF